MKKILMGTSALAMTGAFAGQADAATWDLDWGGYYEASVAYRDSDAFTDTQDGVDVITDSEIIFTPSITLDNGLTFGVNIQLEGNSQAEADIIDESYAFVKGSFGQVVIGSTDSAGAAMMYSAPDVSWIGASSGSLTGLLAIGGGSGVYTQPGGGDSAKIVYYTPRFSGFQLGVSYSHDGSEDKRSPSGRGIEDAFDVGANYVNSFGAFDIAVAARYATSSAAGSAGTVAVNGLAQLNNTNTLVAFAPGAQPANSTVVIAAVPASAPTQGADPNTYAAHLTLGYAGFKLGGSYARIDPDLGGSSETDFFDLGASYTTGPWGVSFQYSHTDNPGNDVDQYLGAVSYKLGPGVTAGAYAGFAEQDFNGGADIDGYIVGTGFKLAF